MKMDNKKEKGYTIWDFQAVARLEQIGKYFSSLIAIEAEFAVYFYISDLRIDD
jgi:hypothetical protein